MPRSARPLVLLISAALIAGCGGASSSTDSGSAPVQKPAPKTTGTGGGELRVGVTDGGIGTAARGDKRGLEQLPNGTVETPSNTQQGVGAGASCQNTDIAPSAETLPTVIASTLCLLNGERQDAGLPPLTENAQLASAALAHSREMVDKQYFDHVAPDGSDPVARIRSAGYIPSVGAWTVGENLAWGTGALATPKEIVKAWMNSTGHRENILRPAFKEIGFGVVPGNPRSANGAGATYTTTFGGVTRVATAVRSSRSSTKAKASRSGRKRHSRKARIAKGRRARIAKGRRARIALSKRARVRRAKARARKAKAHAASPSGSH